MTNHITKDTYGTWLENIEYLITKGKRDNRFDEDITQQILDYLEEEGAFEVVEEEKTVEWVKTDDLQWRRKTGDTEYELIEVRDYGEHYVVVTGYIDLDDYTDEEKANYIKTYGYPTLKDVYEGYSDAADGVIAECIFEQTATNELRKFGPYFSEDDAGKCAEKLAEMYSN